MWLIVVAGLLVGGMLAGVAAGIFLWTRATSGDDSDQVEVATPSPSPEPSQQPAKKKPPRNTGPGDVRDLPAGLFCRDLDADGFSYSAAVDYWRMHGQPDQMDANRDGIPCETVYPEDRVRDYWGDRMPNPEAPAYVPPVDSTYLDLPSGLFCRDLYSTGYSYGDALSYWYYWGMPSRMDADLNGIPCETVYPKSTVDMYW